MQGRKANSMSKPEQESERKERKRKGEVYVREKWVHVLRKRMKETESRWLSVD